MEQKGIIISLIVGVLFLSGHFWINPNLEEKVNVFSIESIGDSVVREPHVEIFTNQTVLMEFVVTENETNGLTVTVPQGLELENHVIHSYEEILKDTDLEFKNGYSSDGEEFNFHSPKKPIIGKIELTFTGEIVPNGRFRFEILSPYEYGSEHQISGQVLEGTEIMRLHFGRKYQLLNMWNLRNSKQISFTDKDGTHIYVNALPVREYADYQVMFVLNSFDKESERLKSAFLWAFLTMLGIVIGKIFEVPSLKTWRRIEMFKRSYSNMIEKYPNIKKEDLRELYKQRVESYTKISIALFTAVILFAIYTSISEITFPFNIVTGIWILLAVIFGAIGIILALIWYPNKEFEEYMDAVEQLKNRKNN